MSRDGRRDGIVTAILALGARFSDVNLLAYLAAFGGGVVSFLSPCVLPLVPGYLSMVTGLDLAELQDEPHVPHARRIVTTTAWFVAGFGAVFVALGLSATSFGQLLRDHQSVLTRLSGTLMFAMALFLLGSLFLRAPWLYQEKRFHPQLGRFGNAAPAVAGRGVRLRLVAVHRPDPRLDPRHRREPAPRVGGRHAARGLLARPRPAVPAERARCSAGSAARSAG